MIGMERIYTDERDRTDYTDSVEKNFQGTRDAIAIVIAQLQWS